MVENEGWKSRKALNFILNNKDILFLIMMGVCGRFLRGIDNMGKAPNKEVCS